MTSRSTVDSKNWRSGSWYTSAVAPRPSTRTRPESSGVAPATTSSSVVLPEPVRPMTPVTPPESSSVTPSSARVLSPAGPS